MRGLHGRVPKCRPWDSQKCPPLRLSSKDLDERTPAALLEERRKRTSGAILRELREKTSAALLGERRERTSAALLGRDVVKGYLARTYGRT